MTSQPTPDNPYFSPTYPACIEPYTIYVLRYGETPQTFYDRMLTMPAHQVWIIQAGEPFDYTNPMFKKLTGQPLITTDYGLQVLRSGVLPELDPYQFMQYEVIAYPSKTIARHKVAACSDGFPI
ncbi:MULTISPECIES: hypothetical protein [unclassified Leclercia]|uniref:Uncharacterized protein n=1 Tax=Leclercia barmai TaxID=2785629 RepID=A0ABS7RTM8_9ENTR|nr:MULTISPECIES: hypothetical protein [unclassified Leclercia]MBZ0057457.1 hypothetical protein [Leclercia sp. EMC7]MCM5695621.1 hypothetical protein [Leclercia sp. LTM01]MCM5700029.1 hypothetical protein [Leclercia sp. LTM14]